MKTFRAAALILLLTGPAYAQSLPDINIIPETRSKSPEEIDSAVDRVLGQVGLAADKGKMPSELSGGMRKRAGLARALVLEPRILLADEPSSGLDRITASEIDDLLLRQKVEHKTTLIVVTHDVRGARA